jgi:hypothetical protein
LGASQSPPLPPVLPPPVFAPPRSGGSFSPLGAAPAARSAEETPSDYTQMIQQSVTPAPALPKAPKQTAEPDKPRKRSIPLGLIIALNVVLVLSIVLVVYFIFRPSPPTAAPQGGVPLPATPATPAAPQVPPAKLPAVTAPKTPVP